jgi:hypothetical protein
VVYRGPGLLKEPEDMREAYQTSKEVDGAQLISGKMKIITFSKLTAVSL